MIYNSFDYKSINYYNYRLNYRSRDTFSGNSNSSLIHLIHYFHVVSYPNNAIDSFNDNSIRFAKYNFVIAAGYNDRRKKCAKVTFTHNDGEKPKSFWQISMEEIIDNDRDRKRSFFADFLTSTPN